MIDLGAWVSEERGIAGDEISSEDGPPIDPHGDSGPDASSSH